jgi:ACS family sodium-dependent inorganic phosphate cotransporter
MCAMATFLCYVDRVAISVAVLPMAADYGWSATMRGLVLSSFFIGYALAMTPAGWLAARYGGRAVVGVALLLWAALTIITPLASASLTILVAARAALGASQAVSFPAAYNLFGRMLRREERSRAGTVNLAAIPIGSACALVLSGSLIHSFGWPSVFYVFGALGLPAAAIWVMVVPSPSRQSARGNSAAHAAKPTLRDMMSHRPVQALVINHFCVNWTLYMMLTWLPSYFSEVHHLSIAGSGVYSIAPWICQFASSLIAGVLADRRIATGVAITRVRKEMQCVGLLGSAFFLLVASQASSSGPALVCACLALAFSGVTWAGFAVNHLDLAPRCADRLWGLTNTAGSLPGVLGVSATGVLLDLTGGYAAAFVLAALVSLVGAGIWLSWGSGEELQLASAH